MKLNRTPNPLDRNARNSENENWKKIEGAVGQIKNVVDDFVGEVSDEAFNKIIDNIKLNWMPPVDNFEDLPINAQVGDTVMIATEGKVYRYNGESWEEIQKIDTGPLGEIDSRLTKDINEVKKELNELSTNVTNFGAVGDGDHDDASYIQEAINEVHNNGGGTVFIPNGVYLISELDIKDDVTLTGLGTLKLLTDKNTPITLGKNSSINGLRFNGNGMSNKFNHAAITVQGDKSSITNNYFTDFYDKIIVGDYLSTHLNISNNYFYNNGYVGNCNAISIRSSFNTVRGNVFLNHGDGHGIRTGNFDGETDAECYYVDISNNFFKEMEHNAITIENNTRYTSVVNNKIINTAQAVKAESSSHGISHLYVSGNYMENITRTTSFNLLGVEDCKVTDNILKDSGGAITVGDRGLVKGNRIENGVGGISAADNTVIEGNYIKSCTGRPINQYSGTISNNILEDCYSENGLLISTGRSADDSSRVINNTIINPREYQGSLSGISFVGTGTVVMGNTLRDINTNARYLVYARGQSKKYAAIGNVGEVNGNPFFATNPDPNSYVEGNLKI